MTPQPARFELYFGELKVGVVTPTDSDFPNLWGTIVCEDWLSSPKSELQLRMARFVDLDRESMRLIDVEHECDVAAELGAVNAELEEYRDVIDSEAWHFLDRQGRTIPVLVPVFRDNDQIVWRWAPGGG